MLNLEHELTVDDLIVEYIVCKVKNGYNPNFLTSEFVTFLKYFESKMVVDDVLYDGKKLLERFFERKNATDWKYSNIGNNSKKYKSHLNMKYDNVTDDYYISANYDLSPYDMSVINTYFMDIKKIEKIRNIICDYLVKQPKRTIDDLIQVNDKELIVGKYIAALLLTTMWSSFSNLQNGHNGYPIQYSNINQLLLHVDFTKVMDLKTIKKELLDFYNCISKKIAIMYQQDKNLKISTYNTCYLANANYDLLIKENAKLFNLVFGANKNSLFIDLERYTFIENCKVVRNYNADYDDEIDTQTVVFIIDNEKTKKLVSNIDKSIQKVKK